MSKTRKDGGVTRSATKRKFEGENATPSRKHKKTSSSSNPMIPDPTEKRQRRSGPAQARSIDHDETVAMKDPGLLGDLFAQKLAKHYTNSTDIEQQDMSIPRSWIRDTTDFDQAHVASNLPAYLERFVEGGKETLSTCNTEATPHTLIVASSGIRVADLVRELRVFNTDNSKVAKLIAKHMKLKENAEYLAKTKVGIAVGTPSRLKDLIEQNAIGTHGLMTIVIDASYLDEKKRALTDMADLFKPLLQLLHHESVKPRLEAADGAKLLVF